MIEPMHEKGLFRLTGVRFSEVAVTAVSEEPPVDTVHGPSSSKGHIFSIIGIVVLFSLGVSCIGATWRYMAYGHFAVTDTYDAVLS